MNITPPLIREPLIGDIAPPSTNIPNTSLATIKQYFSEMNMEWEVGSQLALLDGTPYTRRFSFPSFPQYDDDRLDYIPLQAYSEAYKGSAYFQLTTRFIETEYYSTASTTHKNFTRWEKNISYFNQEIVYSTEVLSTITWNRPSNTLELDPIGSPPIGGPPPTSCAAAFPITSPTPSSTGTSAGFLSGTGGTEENPTSICKQWKSLPIPFSLVFAAGKAIAVSVTSDAPFSLLRKSSPSSSGGDIVSGLVLMTKPYLQINFNATSTSPTIVTVTTYGKELWRSFSPVFIDSEPDILVHPDGTPLSTRLRPPSISVNDSFWNNSPNMDPFQDFAGRQSQGEGSFI